MTPSPPDGRTRWCRRGDTISTVRSDGNFLHATCPTPESCAEANDLIAGRWRVSRCGQCKRSTEECECYEGHVAVTPPATRKDGTR